MVNIGALRHRVAFQKGVQIRNPRMEAQFDWQDLKTVWAGVLPESGREFYRAKQENQEISGLLRIRFYPGLIEVMKNHPVRALFRGRTLEVLWVRDLEERRVEMLVGYKEAQ